MLYNDQNFYYSKCKKALCFTLLLLKDVDLRKIYLKVFGKLNTWNSKMSIKGKNFCRNKAPLIVSHSNFFLLYWFNSNNIEHHIKNMVTLYEQGRRGEKITSAKGQYFKNSQASLLSFMRCFMAIVLFWLVIFFYNCVRPFRTLEWCNFFPSTQRKHKTKKIIA